MDLEISEGLIHISQITVFNESGDFIVYKVLTEEKRPEVISWGSSTVTLLPAGKDWSTIRPADYTVLRFPEKKGFTSVYLAERYCVYFIQFSESDGRVVWEKSEQ